MIKKIITIGLILGVSSLNAFFGKKVKVKDILKYPYVVCTVDKTKLIIKTKNIIFFEKGTFRTKNDTTMILNEDCEGIRKLNKYELSH